MIFYIARTGTGRRFLAPTQADARLIDRRFTQIDVPTDKAGLMSFVQDLFDEIDRRAPGEVQLVPAVTAPAPAPAPAPSYAAQSAGLEDAWEQLPLPVQLHYASLALERARREV